MSISKENIYKWILVISIFVSFLMHHSILDKEIKGLHNWRQAQTMWNVRNFYRHDSNILNARVSHFNGGKDNLYRYEFPMMQWSIAMLQKIFGERIIVARVCIFLIGIVSIYGFYKLLFLLGIGKISAAIGAVFFQFSPLFYYYTINPIPDNLALCGAIWYMYFIFHYIKNKKSTPLLLACFSLLIATFAKLPFLMFAIVSITYFFRSIYEKPRFDKNLVGFIAAHLFFITPAFLWYAWVMPTWTGNGILTGIFSNPITWNETFRILYYHLTRMFPLILLNPLSCFFFLVGFVYFVKQKTAYKAYIWSVIFITFLYWILQFNMIGTVHDYYMMPFLIWLYLIVGFGIYALFNSQLSWRKIILLASTLSIPVLAFLLTKNNRNLDMAFGNKDLYLYQDELKKIVPDKELCIMLNDESFFVFSYMVDKMGYIFGKDYLPASWVEDLVKNHQVKYMYSDSRIIDQSPEIIPYIDSTLLKAGSIHVFKLKTIKD